MTTKITNFSLIGQDGVADDFAIAVRDGKIAEVGAVATAASQEIDLGGCLLVPGFVDVQVNGAGGALFQEAPTIETLQLMADALEARGVTSFMPTLTPASDDVIEAACSAIQAFNESSPQRVLGLTLEGPFIAPAKAGMADASLCRDFDRSTVEHVLSALQGLVLMLTLAPEIVSPDEIAWLLSKGVVVSLGHTGADVGVSQDALDAGARNATHILNAMTGISGREPGLAGAVLASDQVTATAIGDGFHLHDATLSMLFHSLGPERLAMISDGMPPLGSDVTSFAYGENTITFEDGVCKTQDGVLAGTAVDVFNGLRRAAGASKLPLADLLPSITSTPARILGLADDIGGVKPGMAANFVVLEPDSLDLKQVLCLTGA